MVIILHCQDYIRFLAYIFFDEVPLCARYNISYGLSYIKCDLENPNDLYENYVLMKNASPIPFINRLMQNIIRTHFLFNFNIQNNRGKNWFHILHWGVFLLLRRSCCNTMLYCVYIVSRVNYLRFYICPQVHPNGTEGVPWPSLPQLGARLLGDTLRLSAHQQPEPVWQ